VRNDSQKFQVIQVIQSTVLQKDGLSFALK